MTTNGEWLDYLAQNAPDELAAWFDAEHVETKEQALDGDTDDLERKSADLIHEYYKPMVSELQAKVDRLTFDISLVRKNRDKYRSKFGKCLDYADAIHALMDDEGMA